MASATRARCKEGASHAREGRSGRVDLRRWCDGSSTCERYWESANHTKEGANDDEKGAIDVEERAIRIEDGTIQPMNIGKYDPHRS